MAMIKCPVCGNDISTSDTKCVNCGSDQSTIQFELKKQNLIHEGVIKDTNKKKNRKIIIIELSSIILFITIYLCLFLPRILDVKDYYKKERNIKKCAADSGDWDEDLNLCIQES